MYTFKLADIPFIISCLQHPVTDYIQFASSSTRSSSSCKLVHQSSQLNTYYITLLNTSLFFQESYLPLECPTSNQPQQLFFSDQVKHN